MPNYFIRRLIELPPVLLLVSVIIFLLIHLVPGDPIAAMVGPSVTEEQILALRQEYGLSDPLPVQYGRWLGRVVTADLGRSIRTGEEVRQMIAGRLPASLTLAGLGMVWALLLAVPLGIIAATKQNTIADYGASLAAIAGQSVPNFVLAVVLVLIFAVQLRWTSVSVQGDIVREPWTTLPSYLLPSITLGFTYAAQFMRLLRSSLLEVLGQSYITVARAKGLVEYTVLFRHALRNALIPLVTVVGTSFVYMLGSAIIIEKIFNVPGLGNLMIRAVLQRDIPVIQGIALAISLIFILANLAVDIIYVLLNPKLSP